MAKEITAEQLMLSGLEGSKSKTETPILTLESIQATIEQQKKLPREERDYIYTYFLLEQFALQQNSSLSKEDIRNDIKTKFNTAWFSQKITALFKLQNPDQLIFTEIIFESLLKTLLKHLGVATLQRLLNESTEGKESINIRVTKDKIDLSNLEQNIYLDTTNLEQHIKNLNEIIKIIYNYSRNNLGASATEKIFSESFHQLKQKYISIPTFQTAVKNLPEGILERERLDLLTKDELENVSKRLKQVDTMKSEFTNIAAHELKTPLVPMIGYTDMILKNPKNYGLNEKGLELIKIFARNSARLKNLVDDILDVSKLESGEMKFTMQKIVLVKTINEVITDLQPLAKEKNIALKVILSPKNKRQVIKADPKRLSQVISNLVKNAIKFTDKGSITIKVVIKDNFLNLSVTDTGDGIAKEDLTKIFEKFYQAQQAATRKTKGTGLGLAITKKIVEAHGGTIKAQSAGRGKGTTITLKIPILRS
jgi:signal transduction histidine kinase